MGGRDARMGVPPLLTLPLINGLPPGRGDACIGVPSTEGMDWDVADESRRRHSLYGALPVLMAFAMAAPTESVPGGRIRRTSPAVQLPSNMRSTSAMGGDSTSHGNSTNDKDKSINSMISND